MVCFYKYILFDVEIVIYIIGENGSLFWFHNFRSSMNEKLSLLIERIVHYIIELNEATSVRCFCLLCRIWTFSLAILKNVIASSVYRHFDHQIIIGKQNINLLLAIVYESIDYVVPVIFVYYLYTCFVIFFYTTYNISGVFPHHMFSSQN